jgi:hypothetical protein
MGELPPEWNCKSCHKRNGTFGILNRKPNPTAQCKNIHCKKTFSKSGEQRDPPRVLDNQQTCRKCAFTSPRVFFHHCSAPEHYPKWYCGPSPYCSTLQIFHRAYESHKFGDSQSDGDRWLSDRHHRTPFRARSERWLAWMDQ